MVWHHIAQRAGRIIEPASPPHTQRFCCGDLDVVNVEIAPQRLEKGIAKAGDHDVADGFLAQKVVDPVNLAFCHELQNMRIERLSRGKIMPEGFLDHDPAETARLAQQLRTGQRLDDAAEELRRGGQIETDVCAGRRQLFGKSCKSALVGKIAPKIAAPGTQWGPVRLLLSIITVTKFAELGPQRRVRTFAEIHTEDGQPIAHQPVAPKVHQRRDQQPARQITHRAKDHQRGCGGGLPAHSRSAHFGASTWPPKPNRIADNILSPKVADSRDR